MAYKPTPGPWRLEINDKTATAVIYGRRQDGNINGLGEGVVAEIELADWRSEEMSFAPKSPESYANAVLLCHALALSQALQLLRSLVVEGGVPRYRVVPGSALNSLIEEVVDPLLARIKSSQDS